MVSDDSSKPKDVAVDSGVDIGKILEEHLRRQDERLEEILKTREVIVGKSRSAQGQTSAEISRLSYEMQSQIEQSAIMNRLINGDGKEPGIAEQIRVIRRDQVRQKKLLGWALGAIVLPVTVFVLMQFWEIFVRPDFERLANPPRATTQETGQE